MAQDAIFRLAIQHSPTALCTRKPLLLLCKPYLQHVSQKSKDEQHGLWHPAPRAPQAWVCDGVLKLSAAVICADEAAAFGSEKR